MVTVPVKPDTTFPSESRAETWTAGLITVPAAVAVGCIVNTSESAAAAVTLNGALIVPVTPLADAVSV